MIVKTVGKSCKNGAQIWGLQCSSSSLSRVTIILCDVSCCFPISISVAWSAGHQARVWGGDLCWDIWDKGQPHIQGVSQNCLHLVFWHFISQNSSKKQKPMPNWKVVHYDQARGGQPEPEVLWDTLYRGGFIQIIFSQWSFMSWVTINCILSSPYTANLFGSN